MASSIAFRGSYFVRFFKLSAYYIIFFELTLLFVSSTISLSFLIGSISFETYLNFAFSIYFYLTFSCLDDSVLISPVGYSSQTYSFAFFFWAPIGISSQLFPMSSFSYFFEGTYSIFFIFYDSKNSC